MSVAGTLGDGNGKGRYAGRMETLRDKVLFGPGTLDSWIRMAAATGKGVPTELSGYVAQVHARASEVNEGHFEALSQAGYSEDQIFELTVSTALGAGFRRLVLALNALREAE